MSTRDMVNVVLIRLGKPSPYTCRFVGLSWALSPNSTIDVVFFGREGV